MALLRADANQCCRRACLTPTELHIDELELMRVRPPKRIPRMWVHPQVLARFHDAAILDSVWMAVVASAETRRGRVSLRELIYTNAVIGRPEYFRYERYSLLWCGTVYNREPVFKGGRREVSIKLCNHEFMYAAKPELEQFYHTHKHDARWQADSLLLRGLPFIRASVQNIVGRADESLLYNQPFARIDILFQPCDTAQPNVLITFEHGVPCDVTAPRRSRPHRLRRPPTLDLDDHASFPPLLH